MNSIYFLKVYSAGINTLLHPIFYEQVEKLFKTAKEKSKKDSANAIKVFQTLLHETKVSIEKDKLSHYTSVLKGMKNAEDRELITKLFDSFFTTAIKSYNAKISPNEIASLLPKHEDIFFNCLLDVFREFWSTAYIFNDTDSDSAIEKQIALNKIRSIIMKNIEKGLEEIVVQKTLLSGIPNMPDDDALDVDEMAPISSKQKKNLKALMENQEKLAAKKGGKRKVEEEEEEDEEEETDEEETDEEETDEEETDEEETEEEPKVKKNGKKTKEKTEEESEEEGDEEETDEDEDEEETEEDTKKDHLRRADGDPKVKKGGRRTKEEPEEETEEESDEDEEEEETEEEEDEEGEEETDEEPEEDRLRRPAGGTSGDPKVKKGGKNITLEEPEIEIGDGTEKDLEPINVKLSHKKKEEDREERRDRPVGRHGERPVVMNTEKKHARTKFLGESK